MKLETFLAIKSQSAKLLPIIRQLAIVWNGQPIIPMCEVLVQNLSFNGSDCTNFDLERDAQRIKDIHKAIELLQKQSFKNTFIDWLWLEVDSIVSGNPMSEDFE